MSVLWNEARIRSLEYEQKELRQRYYDLELKFYRLVTALELVETYFPPKTEFVKIERKNPDSL